MNSRIRAVAAPALATRSSFPQIGGGKHKQPGDRIGVTGLSGGHRGFVRGQDLSRYLVIDRKAAGMGLGQGASRHRHLIGLILMAWRCGSLLTIGHHPVAGSTIFRATS